MGKIGGFMYLLLELFSYVYIFIRLFPKNLKSVTISFLISFRV